MNVVYKALNRQGALTFNETCKTTKPHFFIVIITSAFVIRLKDELKQQADVIQTQKTLIHDKDAELTQVYKQNATQSK